MRLLIHAGIKINPYKQMGPQQTGKKEYESQQTLRTVWQTGIRIFAQLIVKIHLQ